MVAQTDWTSLLSEVLNLVAKDLTEISDFVRFHAVCTAWRFSTPVTDLPAQFPWIFVPYRVDRYDPNLRFYSMSAGKFYTFCPPKYMKNFIHELSEGYLICHFYDRNPPIAQVYLLNPLNNDKIVLPRSGNQICWIEQRQNKVVEYGISCVRYYVNSKPKLANYRLGQDCWCEPHLDFNRLNYYVYLKGMIFSLDRETGVTTITDNTTGALAYVVPPTVGDFKRGIVRYLEASGDILSVFRHLNVSNDLFFEVHRLDVNKGDSPCWAKVKNIGNKAIFIDAVGGYVLEANDLAGIKANCIYSFSRIIEHVDAVRMEHVDVVRMDIETGVKEYYPYPCPETYKLYDQCWFVPNLCHLRA